MVNFYQQCAVRIMKSTSSTSWYTEFTLTVDSILKSHVQWKMTLKSNPGVTSLLMMLHKLSLYYILVFPTYLCIYIELHLPLDKLDRTMLQLKLAQLQVKVSLTNTCHHAVDSSYIKIMLPHYFSSQHLHVS